MYISEQNFKKFRDGCHSKALNRASSLKSTWPYREKGVETTSDAFAPRAFSHFHPTIVFPHPHLTPPPHPARGKFCRSRPSPFVRPNWKPPHAHPRSKCPHLFSLRYIERACVRVVLCLLYCIWSAVTIWLTLDSRPFSRAKAILPFNKLAYLYKPFRRFVLRISKATPVECRTRFLSEEYRNFPFNRRVLSAQSRIPNLYRRNFHLYYEMCEKIPRCKRINQNCDSFHQPSTLNLKL